MQSPSPPVFRFAPSPNGFLHLGHAYSALLNFELARRVGGRFLLRIEDIDRERSRPKFEAAIYRDLAWLGLTWEEPVRRQSEHFGAYAEALTKLKAMGLIYPAFKSRAEIVAAAGLSSAPRDPDGAFLYPPGEADLPDEKTAALISAGRPYALRLRMAKATARTGALSWLELSSGRAEPMATDPLAWGDAIVARRLTPSSYHLSVTVDDALQGVTHVVRGADLIASTGIHRLLQDLLGLPKPTAYCHHRLLRDDSGAKLSKSAGSPSLAELRAEGVTPADIRRQVGVDEDATTIAKAIVETLVSPA